MILSNPIFCTFRKTQNKYINTEINNRDSEDNYIIVTIKDSLAPQT